MGEITFRKLHADEIECRVAQVSKTGSISLLLYKNARCDMNLLDEVFGVTGWQRSHEVIDGRLYCTVSVYDSEKKQWVSKQDVGTESKTEAEKGQASDSFKRACFNIGIGRELYTAPQIWIAKGDYSEATTKDGKITTFDKFVVKEIGYDNNGNINKLEIVNTKLNRSVFKLSKNGKIESKQATEDKENQKMIDSVDKVLLPTADGKVTGEQIDRLKAEIKRVGTTEKDFCALFKVANIFELTQAQIIAAIGALAQKKDGEGLKKK